MHKNSPPTGTLPQSQVLFIANILYDNVLVIDFTAEKNEHLVSDRPWQSWMARYKNNRFEFERAIKQYTAHRNGDTTTKRPAEIHARLPTAPPVIKTVGKIQII
ncbi:hypothetical protein C8R44DRAFT_742071 [Mycena epipterygia]|nr:hypothetical protein C8R44DRAFT_742071 [Mycena epipterygia]